MPANGGVVTVSKDASGRAAHQLFLDSGSTREWRPRLADRRDEVPTAPLARSLGDEDDVVFTLPLRVGLGFLHRPSSCAWRPTLRVSLMDRSRCTEFTRPREGVHSLLADAHDETIVSPCAIRVATTHSAAAALALSLECSVPAMM